MSRALRFAMFVAPAPRTPLVACLVRGLVALAVMAVLGTLPAAAQSVVARGAEHEDFGRLVIDFTQPTASDISADGDHMQVRLGAPAAVSLGGALANLRTYIRGAKLSADRRRLDIDFTEPVTWTAFNDGLKLAIDFAFADDATQQALAKGPDPASTRLRPAGATAAASAVPVPKAPAPLPKVMVRAGEHQSYSRLAFDGPKDMPYQVRQSGAEVDLAFGRPASIDLDGIAGDLPPRLDSIRTMPRADGVTVRLQVKPGMVARDYRSGNTIVLDITEQTAANAPAAPVMEELQPVPPEPPLDNAPSVATASAMPSLPEAPTAPPSLATELQSAMPEAPQDAPPATVVAGQGASGPGVAVPVAATPLSTFEPPRVAPPAVDVKVSALPLQDGATLYFDWPKPAALAVFRRGNALWLVFDRPGKADLRSLKRLEPMIGKLDPIASPASLALRLVGGASASATTVTEGARWKVTLRPGTALVPTQPSEQRRETLPDGGLSFYISAIASGAPVELQDPADAARLTVTPEQFAGLGVARESDWPDFKLLASYQGIAVERLSDNAKVRASPNGVVVTVPPATTTPVVAAAKPEAPTAAPAAPTPTPAVASETTTPAAAAAAETPAEPPAAGAAKPLTVVAGLFDFNKWRGSGPDTFQTDLAELKARFDSASPADRNPARLALAELYLANGFAPEASSQIGTVLKDDHNAPNTPLTMALAALAHTMSGEYDDATRLLAAPALQGVAEGNLLRAFIAAVQGRTDEAAKLFSGPLPDISAYPKSFRTRVRVLAAKALLDYGDPLSAQNYLDPLKSDDPDAETAARADYLEGLRLSKLGQKEAAKLDWEKLADSPVDEIKARSRFALVSQKLDEKSIDPADAVKELEALRFLWRGDTFEFDLLYKLGKLYFDADQPRKSLITLRQAATHFPDHPLAKQAADDMAGEFHKLYLDGAADRLSPLTAVALYDEFRELTPSGAEGDRMIAALADRLVKVDLLDRAGDLLERQVKTRLSGADKAAVGTRLAAVRLLDDKPDQALTALKESDDPAAPTALVEERNRLQARAMFDTGDTLKGLDLVRADDSLEGLWLKSDMYWQLREWPSAAEALGALIDAEEAKRGAVKAPDTSQDIAKNPVTVLDKAIAQAQAAAAADAPPAPADTPPAANPPAANATPPAAGATPPADTNAPPQPAAAPSDPLPRLILNRAVALSLANDRRGLKEIGRDDGKLMEKTALAEPFKVLTSPDAGLAESITAQMKSIDQLGVFADAYKKILQSQSLSGATEPNPDLGPTTPTGGATSGAAPSASSNPQTAEQSAPQASGQ